MFSNKSVAELHFSSSVLSVTQYLSAWRLNNQTHTIIDNLSILTIKK